MFPLCGDFCVICLLYFQYFPHPHFGNVAYCFHTIKNKSAFRFVIDGLKSNVPLCFNSLII